MFSKFHVDLGSFQIRSLIASGFGIFVVGCGGSGSSGPPVVPQTAMRSNVVGDDWSYSVTANLPPLGASSGTFSVILGEDTYNNEPSIRDTQTFNLEHQGQNVTISAVSEFSSTGALEAVQSSGSLVPVASDTFASPKTIGPNTDIKGVLTLADGTTQNSEYKVVGKERVTVPAGTFDCWIVVQVQTQSGGTKDYFTLDVAPELGTWVKATSRTDYSGGQVFTWQAQLFSSTTAPANRSDGQSTKNIPLLSVHP